MFKLIHIDGTDLICYCNGDIWRYNLKQKKWTKVVSKFKGYWQIEINGKKYLNNRIIANAFLGLDLNSNLVVDHINHDIHNNSVENLRCITQQQNTFNRICKGYYKQIRKNKNGTEVEFWEIKIVINGKQISKSVATEQEAILGYLELKRIHHIIV
jgi:hypothetical protein